MADPEFDPTTGWWYIRYRTGKGTREKKTLQKDARWTKGGKWPPKGKKPKATAEIQLLARPFQDLDTQARLGQEVKIPRATPIEAFLARHQASYAVSHKPASVNVLKYAVVHLLEFVKARKIVNAEAMKRSHVREYMEQRRREGAKYNTIKNEKSILGAAWQLAVEEERLLANPWSKVPIPGADDSTATPHWSESEVKAIAEQLDGWARDVFVVGVNCGFRINALLNLQRRDVRWTVAGRQFGGLVCRKENSKNKKEYSVPLLPAAHDVLARRFTELSDARPGALIFPGKGAAGRPMTRKSFAQRVIKAVATAKVEDKGHHCHAMRATFATIAVARGVNPRALQAWLSHHSMRQTDKYVGHGAEADDREASKLQDGIGTKPPETDITPPPPAPSGP